MGGWASYTPQDFLLFSPRVYWRLFELHNAAVWPLHIVALLCGVAVLAAMLRPRAWQDRAVGAALAAAWAFVGWSFLAQRYAPVNWAVGYIIPCFALQAVLLLLWGAFRGALVLHWPRGVPGVAGAALYLYALAAHPLVAPLAGRPLVAGEVIGVAPDPTAIATLGLVTLGARGGVAWLLIAVPALWCLFSAATLFTMGAAEGWLPLAAVVLAVAAKLWPGRRVAE
ncbi:MAG: DUF6064 family protein [Acetobacterales bacterium]